MKSSSDVVGALIKELRLQSGQPESVFRLAVAIDGVNGLWGKSTIKKEDKSIVRKPTFTLLSCLVHVSGLLKDRGSLFSSSGGTTGVDCSP